MIEIIKGLPDNVVGIVVSGRMTQKDCAAVLVPAIERSRTWHYRLRLYYEIRSRYPGALWDDIDLGLEYAPLWERVAVVTDVAAVRQTITALRVLLPGEIRVFALSQVPEGLAWIIAGDPARAGQKGGHTFPRRRLSLLTNSRTGESRALRPPAQYIRGKR
jgi:hypothetical protein